MVTYIFNGECQQSIKQAFIDTYLQKLELVVETTTDYKKSGIDSAERNYASMPVVIDWGDGTVERVDGNISQKVHEYATVGTFNVIVKNIKSYAASTNNSTWYNTTSQNAYTLKEVVVIPDSVTSISTGAFSGCSRLTSVMISDGIMNIGYGAFSDCSGLMSFTVGDGNVNYKSVNGLLLSKNGKTLIAGINGDVTIPDGIAIIWTFAFEGMRGLTSVTIPNSVTSIGEYVFFSCNSLTNMTIPDSVTSIGQMAFQYCNSLTSVTITGDDMTKAENVKQMMISAGASSSIEWHMGS